MTENLQKLMDLVTEVSDLTKKVNADTAALKAEYDANNQAKLDRIRKELEGYITVARELSNDVYVKTDGYSRYSSGEAWDNLALKISGSTNVSAGVYTWDKGKCISYLGCLGPEYKRAKRGDYNSNLSYDIDEIIDNWNSEQFERRFSEAVRDIIQKKAEKANRAYEEAKKRLEEQR